MSRSLAVRTCLLGSCLVACAVDARVYTPKNDSLDLDAGGTPVRVDAGKDAGPPVTVAPDTGPRGSVVDAAMPPTRTKVRWDQTGPDNPAGLSADEVARLVAGGPIGSTKWLYPYDGTVFPRGTVAPLVMWQSDGPADAVYLHIDSTWFEYKGVLRPSVGTNSLFIPANTAFEETWLKMSAQGPTGMRQEGQQLAIPQLVWEQASLQSLGKGDPFRIEATVRVRGEVHGALKSSVTIAQASVKGSIYYSTCLSSVPAQNPTGVGSGSMIMRIPPGGNAELLTATTGTQCIGCHAVSSDGSRVVAQRLATNLDVAAQSTNPSAPTANYALTYLLGPDGRADPSSPKPIGQPPPANTSMFAPWGAFGAVYPDGSKYLSSSQQVTFHRSYGYALAMLYDTATGEVVEGTGIPGGAAMPMFSPDGRYLVFNDAPIDIQHTLAVMDYDVRQHKASNYQRLVSEDLAGPTKPGWPTFLPDNKAVVFTRTASSDFSGVSSPVTDPSKTSMGGLLARDPSDLYIVDIETKKVTLLARAMGFATPEDAATDNTYLPYGIEDLHRNYYPTVAPTAAGGYFWVFFDSLRHFGSLGLMRVLWGAAIDIRADGNYALDPSHPPFYVAGQEFSVTSHFRAFAALDRCKQDLAPCKTGIDCCSGFCALADATSVDPVGTCAPPPTNGCAKRDERCVADSDCCDSENNCINGFCAYVELL